MEPNLINDLYLHNLHLSVDLEAAIKRVISSGWFILGPEVEAFEREFAEYCGAPHCVSVANGTDAIELALRGLGVTSNDEVITCANGGMYSTNAILATGAKPVYADINEECMTLSVESVSSTITPRTAAIIATHLYGRMSDVRSLRELADCHGIFLIEDCAQAHGAILDGRRAGSWGDAAAFSFYPTKNLGCLGDGGAITVKDSKIATHLKSLRQYGWQKKYQVVHEGGRNSRLDEIQAAILRIKLKKLDRWNELRRAIAIRYIEDIKNANVKLPRNINDSYAAHLFVIKVDQRDKLQTHLRSNKIGCDVHYPILDYKQPILKNQYSSTRLSNSENAVQQILTLPCYPELSLDQISIVCETINNWTP